MKQPYLPKKKKGHTSIFKVVSCAIILVGLFIPTAHSDGLRIITANPNPPKLSKLQIKQVYLESGAGLKFKPVNFSSGSQARILFNTKILGLTEGRISSYWAQMKFTGRGEPPIEVSSISALFELLKQDTSYIAYIPASVNLPEDYKVMFQVK